MGSGGGVILRYELCEPPGVGIGLGVSECGLGVAERDRPGDGERDAARVGTCDAAREGMPWVGGGTWRGDDSRGTSASR